MRSVHGWTASSTTLVDSMNVQCRVIPRNHIKFCGAPSMLAASAAVLRLLRLCGAMFARGVNACVPCSSASRTSCSTGILCRSPRNFSGGDTGLERAAARALGWLIAGKLDMQGSLGEVELGLFFGDLLGVLLGTRMFLLAGMVLMTLILPGRRCLTSGVC